MLRFRMSDFKQPKPRIVIIATRRPGDSLYSPLCHNTHLSQYYVSRVRPESTRTPPPG